MLNLRKLALILGVSYVALCADLQSGHAVLPPASMVQEYLHGKPSFVTRDDLLRATILPGIGGIGGFMASGGGGANNVATVFAITAFTGTGAIQTVTTGVNNAAGSLVLIKDRGGSIPWYFDTAMGANNALFGNNNSGMYNQTSPGMLTAFGSTGFTLGSGGGGFGPNTNGSNLMAYSFLKAANFLDIVSYTGNGVAGRTISHSAGTPGFVIIKRKDTSANWWCWHAGLPTSAGTLEGTTTFYTTGVAGVFGDGTSFIAPTSSNVTVGANTGVNASGGTYEMYVFAHDPTGVIACGSYTGNGSSTGPAVTLGWEPQYVEVLDQTAGNIELIDSTRSTSNTRGDVLYLNKNTGEPGNGNDLKLDFLSTGFQVRSASFANTSGTVYPYMAIRKP